MDMSAVVDSQICNYYCVKFPILPHLTEFQVMEFVTNFIKPEYVTALMPNHEEAIVGVYVNNLECFCLLLQNGITVQGYHMCSLPMIDAYTASNVFPMVSNDALTELFRIYGDIIEVQYIKTFLSNKKYDHIISNKRRLYFRLSGQNSTICIPKNVKAKIENVLVNIKIEQYCLVCSSDGHNILHCEDLRDFICDTKIFCHHETCGEPFADSNISYAVELHGNLNSNKTSFVQNIVTENVYEHYELPRIQMVENASNILQINFDTTSLSEKCIEEKNLNDLRQKIPEIKNEGNAKSLSKNFLDEGKENDLPEHEILKIQIDGNSIIKKVYISPSMPDIVNSRLHYSPTEKKCLISDDDMPLLSSHSINNDF